MALSLLLPSLFSPNISSLCQWAASLCALCALYKISKYYMRWRELVAAFQPFPGPPCHWLYGNAREFLKIGEDLNFALHWAKTYKYGFPLWLGNFHAWLVVTHPDYAKTILSRQDPKDDAAYRFIVPWIGEGLLVLSGPKWFRHRRLLTPGFYYVVLKPYVGLMADCTKTMLDKWENLDQDKSVELFHHVSLMTLDSIMKCSFNYHSNCQTDSDNDYIKAVYELSYQVDFRFRNFLYHNDFIYNLSSHGRRFRKAQMIAHQHTDKVIKERIKLLHYERGLDKSIRNKRLLDFLDILLCAKDENGKRLSHKDLRAEVDTFMFEGHDTTASGISWIFYCMAKHPEHQEKCREEIREVLGDRDTMELEDLAKIPYTTMCIKESLRLYPPVPGIARKLSKPITFCDGRSLPEGSLIILSIYCINKSSLFWKDPEVFDPLRFSVENSSDRHPHAFLPFAAGPRNCIGQNFAMNEMKVAVALTLQRFQLLPDPDNEPIKIPQIVLRSLNGIHIKLKKIERDSTDNTPTADIDHSDV